MLALDERRSRRRSSVGTSNVIADRVVGERLDRADPERVEDGVTRGGHARIAFSGPSGHQWDLKWSNGSVQALHTHKDLHAVEPKRLSSRVSGDPHCGQRSDRQPTGPPPSARVRVRARLRRHDAVGRAASLALVAHPVGGPRRREHQADVDVVEPGSPARLRTSAVIASIAGQPEYVGVIVTLDVSVVVDVDVAQDAEVLDRQDRHLGVEHLGRRRPGRSLGRQVVESRSSPRWPPGASAPGAASRRAGSPSPRCGCRAGHPCAARAPSARSSVASAEHGIEVRRRRGPRSVDGSTATPARTSRAYEVVGLEQLGDVRPQLVEPALHAQVRLVGAVAESQRPLRRVVTVVVDLLDGLGRDRRERLVGRRLEVGRRARTGRPPRPASGPWCRRSRRAAARRSGVEEVALVAEVRERRPRRGPPPPPRRRRSAASAPGRAGRARCCRARRPPRAAGRRRSSSPSRCA